jgi:hypothetical protein
MSESRAKKRAHAGVVEACPHCIYCGGEVLAATIDHVPPRVVFRGKHRPKGLEFASCRPCNEGTSKVDLVVGLLSRVAPDGVGEAEKAELTKLLSGVNNNVPGLLEEMHLGEREQLTARRRLQQPVEGGFLRTDGPLVSSHMQTFATKLGFALFYEVTRKIVPMAGGVAARWYSNVDRLDGTFPQSVFERRCSSRRSGIPSLCWPSQQPKGRSSMSRRIIPCASSALGRSRCSSNHRTSRTKRARKGKAPDFRSQAEGAYVRVDQIEGSQGGNCAATPFEPPLQKFLPNYREPVVAQRTACVRPLR